MTTMMVSRLALSAVALWAVAPAAATAEPAKSTTAQVANTAESIAQKPLKDLNLQKDSIPPQLLAIMNKPYDIGQLKGCADYKAEIAKLTKVLGPDVDFVNPNAKKGQTNTEMALEGAQAAVGSLLPASGLVRKLSGAEAADKKARAAVLAGALRRAFVKGTASAKGCAI